MQNVLQALESFLTSGQIIQRIRLTKVFQEAAAYDPMGHISVEAQTT
jgi:hypothetical protein